MVQKLRVLDLFSGIGGLSLGLERTGGFETVAFCEIEEFPRRVLAQHWPEVPCYHDVTKLNKTILSTDGIAVDVITGGFPCQDISCAGKRAGIAEGTRSGLWSEIVRLIGELQPRYVLVENVSDLLTGPGNQRGGWFGRVLGDLAECGYDAEWQNIPAGAFGAIHLRKRVWILAYPAQVNERPPVFKRGVKVETGHCPVPSAFRGFSVRSMWGFAKGLQVNGQPLLCEPNERLSYSMVQRQLAAFGNTVFPQIPEMIGNAILLAEAKECSAAL